MRTGPLGLWLDTWGYEKCDPGEFAPCDRYPEIKTKMEIDYIRIWQPENRYTDMEPVYR